ncbi:MAG: helix-hairpin-helix domain-containing protein, partial [Coraliomargaritaceae bacterium]
MGKGEIIKILKEIGVLLELKGENAFKVRAYQSGARTLERLEENFEQIVEAGRLKELKGIGQALVQKIELLYREGRLPFYEDLKASVAPGLLEFLEIPGLGGKKVKVIYDQLGIDTMDALKEACTSGTIEALEGFGKKSAEKILSGIENRKAYGKRHLWWSVTDLVERILDILRAHPNTIRAEVAGSYRRSMETVGDLDFIVASESASELMELFVALEGVKEVTAKGITKSSVRFESGIQADLRVVPEEAFVFALHHFTGSKDHNVLMRQRALSMGYRLSEWGIFDKNSDDAEPLKVSSEIQSECDLFKFFKLSPIVPELREGFDEVSRAEASNMPSLVQASSIKGVFHNHTTASDGLDTLEDMVKAAERLGWSYIGFADHSKASYQANGLSEDRVLKLIDSIKQFNDSKQSKVKVFSGI